MARIELAPEVFDDFDRFLDHMSEFEVEAAPERIGEIVQAVQILTHSPLIGRPVKGGKRELVIGRDSRGLAACCIGVLAASMIALLARTVVYMRVAGLAQGTRADVYGA